MVQFWCGLGVHVASGESWWVLVGSGCSSGVFWCGSCGFWWVLVNSGTVLVCFGGVLAGSGDFWWILVGCVEFWSSSGLF
jgi:hypothetical protein